MGRRRRAAPTYTTGDQPHADEEAAREQLLVICCSELSTSELESIAQVKHESILTPHIMSFIKLKLGHTRMFNTVLA